MAGGKGGVRRRRRENGCGRSGANEPYWAEQQEERLNQRTFWPKQPLTPRPKKLRPLRRAAGGGEGAWLRLGAGLRGDAGGRGERWVVATRSDVRSSWSRGLPPAADVRTTNNRERSVEGGIPCLSLRSPSFHLLPPPGAAGEPRLVGPPRGLAGFAAPPLGLRWRALTPSSPPRNF